MVAAGTGRRTRAGTTATGRPAARQIGGVGARFLVSFGPGDVSRAPRGCPADPGARLTASVGDGVRNSSRKCEDRQALALLPLTWAGGPSPAVRHSCFCKEAASVVLRVGRGGPARAPAGHAAAPGVGGATTRRLAGSSGRGFGRAGRVRTGVSSFEGTASLSASGRASASRVRLLRPASATAPPAPSSAAAVRAAGPALGRRGHPLMARGTARLLSPAPGAGRIVATPRATPVAPAALLGAG